jgi:hypothetical protein
VSALRTAINTSAWADEDEQDKAAWLGDLLQRDAEFKQALSADVGELKGDLRKMGTKLERIMSTHIVMINNLEECTKSSTLLSNWSEPGACRPTCRSCSRPRRRQLRSQLQRQRRHPAPRTRFAGSRTPSSSARCARAVTRSRPTSSSTRRSGTANGATPPGTPPAVYPVRTAGTPPAGSGSGGYANPHMLADVRKSASSSQVVRRTGSTAAVAVLTSPAAGDVSAAALLARTSQ